LATFVEAECDAYLT